MKKELVNTGPQIQILFKADGHNLRLIKYILPLWLFGSILQPDSYLPIFSIVGMRSQHLFINISSPPGIRSGLSFLRKSVRFLMVQ